MSARCSDSAPGSVPTDNCTIIGIIINEVMINAPINFMATAMTKLTNNQKKFLRSMGHVLKPVVMIGQHGLSDSVLAELESICIQNVLGKIYLSAETHQRS